MKKRDIITLSTLGGVLLALILVFFLAVAPLLKEEQLPITPPEALDGEVINNLNGVSLYAPITTENLVEIAVKNESGEYSFVPIADDKGVISMVIKGHTEGLSYLADKLAYLTTFAKEPRVPIDGTIIRNQTIEQMAEYATTKELCKAQVTVKYKSGSEQKEYTLYIGNRIMSTYQGYYVAIEGRDHVYCVNASAIDNSVLNNVYSYVSPIIYANNEKTGYKNITELVAKLKDFIIMKVNTDGDYVVMLEQDASTVDDETSASFNFTFPEAFPQKIKASNDYVINLFSSIFMAFAGEEVVALDPDEATLEKFGLGKNQQRYLIYANMLGNDGAEKKNPELPAYYISYEIDGYHYVDVKHSIVKIAHDKLLFLHEDDESIVAWAATNSVYAGFSEYLRRDDEAGEPGVKTIRIRTRDYNADFVVTIDNNGRLSAISKDGKHSFIDNPNPEGAYKTNQFANLYTLLLYYPMPSRFTTLTKEEKDNIRKDENIIYELEVQLNDGKIMKYTYYSDTPGYVGYALCESKIGKVDENGGWIYETPQIMFDVKARHISLIAEAYKIIMEGGSFYPFDYIY